MDGISEALGVDGDVDGGADPRGMMAQPASAMALANVAIAGERMMMENIPSMENRQQTDAGAVPAEERDATPAEARALSHPLRLRILRLCIDEALPNSELAARLGRDPGTTLYHVRRLVALGFLQADPVRRGASGHLEQPYRITGKSWMVRIGKAPSYAAAALDAVREELLEAGPRAALSVTRLGVRLSRGDVAELRRRLDELASDFADRDDPAGTPIGILLLVHRRRS
jgi:hypothetical protein